MKKWFPASASAALAFAVALSTLGIPDAPALSAAEASAEAIRSAQERLKTLGFYTGAAHGEWTPETAAAIRRFQIYSSLNASGELDAETSAALEPRNERPEKESVPPGNRASAPTPPRPAKAPAPEGPQQSDRDFLARESQEAHPSQRPQADPRSDVALAPWYRGTPYENAPAEVQRETLARACTLLERSRFLDAEGRSAPPGPELEEALFRYQSAEGLRLTGRLDYDTLASLRLLPTATRSRVIRQPFFGGDDRDERDDGRAGQEPDAPVTGAVRGIPLD